MTPECGEGVDALALGVGVEGVDDALVEEGGFEVLEVGVGSECGLPVGGALGQRMAGAFVEDDAVVEPWEGRYLEGFDRDEVGFEGVVKLGGAGVAVHVLADVDEESALERPEGQVGVFGTEAGPGPEYVAFGVEGDGLGGGQGEYVHGGHGCHWDAVSVVCADGVGIGGDDVDVGVDELGCEVAVAGADFEEGKPCGHLGDPPDGGVGDDGEPEEGVVLTAECGAVELGEGGCGLVVGPPGEGEVLLVQVLEEGVPVFGGGVFEGGHIDVFGGLLEDGFPGVRGSARLRLCRAGWG